MKISVVIPVFNAASTIVQTLVSVAGQTIKPFEIIVVNDGSTDTSSVLINEFCNTHPDLNIIFIEKTNGGVSTARNLGMLKSTGDWIAFLDADDVWDSKKLQIQKAAIETNHDIDLLGTARNNENEKSQLFRHMSYLSKISSKTLLYKNFFSTPTVMIKKDLINKVGLFDETQKYAEEGDYWIRICDKNNCYFLNESLVVTGAGKPNFGHSGLSGNLREMEKGELKNIKTARKLRIVNYFEFLFLNLYSLSKYIRRELIVKFR